MLSDEAPMINLPKNVSTLRGATKVPRALCLRVLKALS